jgi:hypothetical protein
MFLLKFSDLILIHGSICGKKGDTFDEGKVWVTSELSENPEEGLLVLVIGLCGYVVVLERSLTMESDLSSLDLSVLRVNLVTNENDRNIFADSSQILVPLGNILISDSCSDIEHHNSAMCSNTI